MLKNAFISAEIVPIRWQRRRGSQETICEKRENPEKPTSVVIVIIIVIIIVIVIVG